MCRLKCDFALEKSAQTQEILQARVECGRGGRPDAHWSGATTGASGHSIVVPQPSYWKFILDISHTSVCVVTLVVIGSSLTVLEVLVLYFHELNHVGCDVWCRSLWL